MKNAFILVTLITLGFLAALVFKTKNPDLNPPATLRTEPDQWHTFTKQDGRAKQSETQPEKLKRLKLPDSNPKEFAYERKLEGASAMLYKEGKWQGQMRNSFDVNWKKKLGDQMLHHLPEEAEVHIKKLNSILRLHQDQGRYIEQVLITTVLPNGDMGQFKAEVDSESGKILKTWDRSLNHPLNPKKRHTIPATGTIGN